ncbi:MAG: hypothetical protein O7G87_11690 [bacterium]|nr:hypothetical protein [bacterium]
MKVHIVLFLLIFAGVCPLVCDAQGVVPDIPDSMRKVIFFDDFEDNRNEWPVESDHARLEIKNGRYTIDRSEKTGIYTVSYGDFDFRGEFSVECKMRKVEGDNRSIWYGIVWGRQSEADYSNFLVNPSGKFSLAIQMQNDYLPALDWTLNAAIEGNNKFNVLRVERRGVLFDVLDHRSNEKGRFTYYFSINGTLVQYFETWPEVPGDEIAFRLSENAKVEVDYIKITVP